MRQVASASHRWRAWVGDAERMKRVSRALQELAALTPETSAGVGSSEDHVDEGAKSPYAVRLEARHREFSLTQIGPPEEVLNQADPKTLTSLTLAIGHTRFDRYANLDAHRYLVVAPRIDGSEQPTAVFAGLTLSSSSGAYLQVNGEDPDWVRNAFTRLKGEIAVAVPRWSWLRAGWMWFLYAILSGLVTSYAAKPILGSVVGWYLLAIGTGAVVLGTTMTLLSQAVLPGFQLLRNGEQGKGTYAIRIVGIVLTEVLIGVGVNMITQ